MLKPRYFLEHVLEADLSRDTLFRVGPVDRAEIQNGDVLFTAPLIRQKKREELYRFENEMATNKISIRLRLYGDDVIRIMLSRTNDTFADNSPMLEWHTSMKPVSCILKKEEYAWTVYDKRKVRFRIGTEYFSVEMFPDGKVGVTFQSEDHFFASMWDSLSMGLLIRGNGDITTLLSLGIEPGEHFCGTGERFDRIDLSGRQIDLVNTDAMGVNNARAYKNIPFLISSRPYGLFLHSTAKMRLDIGHQSTRALQCLVNNNVLDIFFIGGGSVQQILLNYRKITGFPRMPPLWSFGSWMSRMTYSSDKEVTKIANRLRQEKYPMDMLHLDTGWFAQDWKCEWKFLKERFPDPADFFRRMRDKGFRITLWQYPYVRRDIDLSKIAIENGYVGKSPKSGTAGIYGDTIDFTNPEAVTWYKNLLGRLLKMGAAAIKADFGEDIDEEAKYKGMDAQNYHNIFSLLYQKTVWEITEQITGNNIIWARSAWAGSQRYPVHWGGDSACSFDGLAGSLCGGLHLGLSGFAFWSHDIGGFHGIPDFMNDRPEDDLYVRWTQVGVFSSHMRFHGTTPREPWEYPKVASVVREWLKFRYALLPYIVFEAKKSIEGGLPLLRSLVIEWTDDPAVWSICDEYMFGHAFLVCPILNHYGVRDIYLPEGKWIDFWSGHVFEGSLRLKKQKFVLSKVPLYIRYGSEIEFAEPVQSTDELSKAKKFSVGFDKTYRGFNKCELSTMIKL